MIRETVLDFWMQRVEITEHSSLACCGLTTKNSEQLIFQRCAAKVARITQNSFAPIPTELAV